MQRPRALGIIRFPQFSVTHTVTSAAIPLHAHLEYVFGFYFQGLSKCRLSSHPELIFGPGDLGLLNPGSAHEDFASQQERDYLTINVRSEFFRDLLTSLGNDARTLPFFAQPKIGNEVEVVALCHAIRREVDRSDFGREIVIQSLVTQLAVQLLRRHPGFRLDPEQVDFNPRGAGVQIKQIAGYLRENCAEEFSLDRLAKIAGLSKFHFERVFKRATGLNPHAFMMRARLDNARYLLRHTNQPIIEIALSLGFADQSHFTNAFKRFIGITPNEYRRETR